MVVGEELAVAARPDQPRHLPVGVVVPAREIEGRLAGAQAAREAAPLDTVLELVEKDRQIQADPAADGPFAELATREDLEWMKARLTRMSPLFRVKYSNPSAVHRGFLRRPL